MSLPVKEGTSHRIYKNTTLQNVVVTLDYGSRPSSFYDEDYGKRLNKFTTDKFSLTLKHGLPDQPFRVNNAKLGSSFIFTNGLVIAIMPRDRYVSFEDTALPMVRRMKEYVQEVIGDDRVLRVMIRKLNIWQVVDMKDEPDAYLNTLKPVVFSDAFLNATNHAPYQKDEEGVLFEKLGWSESGVSLTVRSAFVKVPNKEAVYNLVLDLEVISGDEKFTKSDGMLRNMKDLNQYMFDAFLWCLNDDMIKQMEGEQ